MADWIWTLIAYVCAAGVWVRFRNYFGITFSRSVPYSKDLPFVSIIVPARNESKSIGKLLTSLLHLSYPMFEIIVVDDGSDDQTAQIAESYGVKVISLTQKPAGWVGKTYACHIGAQHATGKVLLFTDADTCHHPTSLTRAVARFRKGNLHMLSAGPFHQNKYWWERLLGAFYVMIHAGASPFDKVSVDHPYALGQYILVDKKFYHTIGGHKSVQAEVADDASLAKRVMQNGGRYSVYHGQRLCEVQMYHSFEEFCTGWYRILRLGMKELRPAVLLYTILPLLALNLPNLLQNTIHSWIPVVATILCFAAVQHRIGNFSGASVIMIPFTILLFVLLSLVAVAGQLFNLPIVWRGRSYQVNNDLGYNKPGYHTAANS